MEFKISSIQPSQIYISRLKLNKINEILTKRGIDFIDPIPIKKLNGRIIATDGHTRLFAAHQMGFEKIEVIWETDNLEWEIYQLCVDWCLSEGITSISDIDEDRILSKTEYQIRWIDRCQELKQTLSQSSQFR